MRSRDPHGRCRLTNSTSLDRNRPVEAPNQSIEIGRRTHDVKRVEIGAAKSHLGETGRNLSTKQSDLPSEVARRSPILASLSSTNASSRRTPSRCWLGLSEQPLRLTPPHYSFSELSSIQATRKSATSLSCASRAYLALSNVVSMKRAIDVPERA